MGKQLDTPQIQLPVPGRLAAQSEAPAGDGLDTGALAEFIASGLKGTAVESWIREHALVIASLPQLAGQKGLSPRQQIYDRYFGINRHGGETGSIIFALAQVLGEISQELQVGSSLDEYEMGHLFDGLIAVLEAASER